MQQTPSGWQLPLYLPEGAYSYRFLVDGKWHGGLKNNKAAYPVVYIGKPDRYNTLSNYQKALAAAERSGNKAEIAAAFAGMGNAYNALLDRTDALNSFQQALRLYEGLKNSNGVGDMCINIADAYRSMSDFPHLWSTCKKPTMLTRKRAMKWGWQKRSGCWGIIILTFPNFQPQQIIF